MERNSRKGKGVMEGVAQEDQSLNLLTWDPRRGGQEFCRTTQAKPQLPSMPWDSVPVGSLSGRSHVLTPLWIRGPARPAGLGTDTGSASLFRLPVWEG